jgi:hypothetical protein
VTPAEDARSVLLNRVSWGAVLAGVVVALVAQLILNMIGIGIGASTLDPGAGADRNPSAQGLSIGAAIWWTVSGILAALAGGFAAGRLAGQPKESTAGWHGLRLQHAARRGGRCRIDRRARSPYSSAGRGAGANRGRRPLHAGGALDARNAWWQ